MNKGAEIARGKTKILYEHPGQPDVLVVTQGDNITAGDGARRSTIDGKGRLASKTTARVFRLLNLCGLPTHYLSGGEDDDDNEMLVRRADMIPIEVVTRGVAAGSFVKRKPGVQRGAIIVPRLVEFFLKDDAQHDPLIEPEEIVARGLATPSEVATMSELARITFEILSHAWRRHDVLLVDLKIEFGRLASGENKGALVIADVIDNDSWRIWPQGREELMLDKQIYRNLPEVRSEDLQRVKAAYETVADMVGSFPQMRPGMTALVGDGGQHVGALKELGNAMQRFGLPFVRHVVSVTATPGYALQLLAQLDATFSRLIVATLGDERSALSAMAEASSPNPVLVVHPGDDPNRIALTAAKSFALDDTVVFGRVLLTQANMRSAIMQADAALNETPPPDGRLA